MNFLAQITKTYSNRSQLVEAVYRNLGLGIAAVVATSVAVQNLASFGVMKTAFYVSLIASFVISLTFSFRFAQLSREAATGLFYGYSVCYGFILAPITLLFGKEQITIAVAGTGLMFAAAIYLSKNFEIKRNDIKLVMIGGLTLLGMSILNIFLKLTILELLISVVGMVVTFGMCTYMISTMELYASVKSGGDTEKVAIIMSLQLLANLINFFIYMLRFMAITGGGGRNRD